MSPFRVFFGMVLENSTHASEHHSVYGILILFFFVFLGISVTVSPLAGLVSMIMISLVIFFSYHLDIGMYILMILYPMIGWQVHADQIMGALGLEANTLTFYAPIVDVWALFLVVAYGLYLIRRWLVGKKHRIYIPGFQWYILFVLSALLSLLNTRGMDFSGGLYYVLRFIIFMYIGYVVVGTNIILSKENLRKTLQVVMWMGVFLSVMGIISFVMGFLGGSGMYRAAPLSLLGWNLFNYDLVSGHILLAEILVVPLPIAVFFALVAKNAHERMWYAGASTTIALATFLTFSRAGWLTLIVEIMLAVYLFRSAIEWKKIKKYVMVGVIALIPMAVYMGAFLQSAVVSSSNSTRIVLTEVAWHMFLEHPIVGQGAGTFVNRLDDVYLFTYEFGNPIDAHSIVMKILSEQGLVGLVTFALFIGYIILYVYRRGGDTKSGLEGQEAAYLSLFLVAIPIFFQLFNTQYYSARMWIPIMLGIATQLVYRRELAESKFYTHFRPNKYKIDTTIE